MLQGKDVFELNDNHPQVVIFEGADDTPDSAHRHSPGVIAHSLNIARFPFSISKRRLCKSETSCNTKMQKRDVSRRCTRSHGIMLSASKGC